MTPAPHPRRLAQWGPQRGARGNFIVLDTTDASLLGVSAAHLLDALVFTSPGDAIHHVYVAGEAVVCEWQHAGREAIAGHFAQAMSELWEGGA